jgi:hypothetical protein
LKVLTYLFCSSEVRDNDTVIESGASAGRPPTGSGPSPGPPAEATATVRFTKCVGVV